jgi:hypothetical protein
MKIFTPLAVIVCSTAFLSASTRADVSELNANSGMGSTTDGTEYFDHNISTTNDLIYGVTGTAIATVGANAGNPISPGIDFPLSGINDGKANSYADGNDTFWGTSAFDTLFGTGGTALQQDPQVTFDLNTTVNTKGYTLQSIQSIFGFTNSNAFADQNYTVEYTTVGDSTWQSLATVAYDPYPAVDGVQSTGQADGTSTDVNLTVTNVQGVNAIRFTFSPFDSNQLGQVVREIEVDGVATPEPSTWAMMIVGAAGVIALSLRRLLRA